ncbi:hypothetical protein [Methylovulum miyakonense]|uniref:hypothetical protein n=1 Tax=Methylovulum miyakonense TaxID=645578 RepID=UPI00037149CA|nr:hypothetical protein [Methylovulum miyakonense]
MTENKGSYWNCRVIEHKGEYPWFGIHEVYYDAGGGVTGITENPVQLVQGSVDDLQDEIHKLKMAFEKPVLDYAACADVSKTCDNLSRDERQKVVLGWAIDTFGELTATSLTERAARFTEEALELAQAVGLSQNHVINILNYVYGRPIGDTAQEIGGVAVSLMALGERLRLSIDECERHELNRILAKDPKFFREKQNSKAGAGVALEVSNGK